MTKLREQVLEFYRAYGQPIGEKPRMVDRERLKLRVALITEEFLELLEALGHHELRSEGELFLKDCVMATVEDMTDEADMVRVADALADLDYVVEGTRIEFGIDGEPIADEVHRSNMSKLGPDGKPVLLPNGKVTKGPNYRAPEIATELRIQGWEG